MSEKVLISMTIVFIVTILVGCGKVITTWSIIKINDPEIDKMQKIVHGAFMNSGYICGGVIESTDEHAYWIRQKNNQGRQIRYFYTVSYRVLEKEMEIKIRNVSAVRDPEILENDRKNLMDIMRKIENMLREAHIEATIETKTRSEFIKACI